MTRSSVSCPVPVEQQPVNEYEELKSAWLFRDCTASVREYAIRIAWIYGLSWLIAGPLSAASFPPNKYIAQFLLGAAAGASIGVVLILVRLYLGWLYVRDRLFSPVIFYEESGWYDGQTWTKPEEILARDRLIVTYQIQPILRRLQLTFALLAVLYIAGSIVWQIL
ncbi:MAG: CGLD27 family protein [Calothrix sp. C42_A2020_038]|nr:CGLD27 family protein [Calothrix sp. C42_A2020_038]